MREAPFGDFDVCRIQFEAHGVALEVSRYQGCGAATHEMVEHRPACRTPGQDARLDECGNHLDRSLRLAGRLVCADNGIPDDGLTASWAAFTGLLGALELLLSEIVGVQARARTEVFTEGRRAVGVKEGLAAASTVTDT